MDISMTATSAFQPPGRSGHRSVVTHLSSPTPAGSALTLRSGGSDMASICIRGVAAPLAAAAVLLFAGCSDADMPRPAQVATRITPTAVAETPSPLPSTANASSGPANDDSEDPGGFPESAEPRAVCLQAMSALEEAGADTVEPSDPAVSNTLKACRTVAEWRGGLEAVPGALGYDSAEDLNEQVLKNDLQVVCIGNLGTPVCKEALRKELL